MNEKASAETSSSGAADRAPAEPDNSLRNFTIGVLAASAVIIVLAYLLQTAAG